MNSLKITTYTNEIPTCKVYYDFAKEIGLLHYKTNEYYIESEFRDTMEVTILIQEHTYTKTQREVEIVVDCYDLLQAIGCEVDVQKIEFLDGKTMTYDKHPTIDGEVLSDDTIFEMCNKYLYDYLVAIKLIAKTK